MKMNEFISKEVWIELKNGNKYNCIINSIDDCGNGLIFVDVYDIKQKRILLFAASEIVRIEGK